jgi:tripartite-type tricarboxylate transporter receptor subunit TctC
MRTATAQTYPLRPVTLLVPYPAGGSTDITLRSLARATEKHLGQPIVIENRGGASGTLAPAQMATNAKPDGYTICQIPGSVFQAPFTRKTTYDPSSDFTYIIGVTGYTYGIAVRSKAPWKTFEEFIADAKANPGTINYGTSGAGSVPHVTMELLGRQLKARWTHVPFKGNAEMNNALLGGHIHAVASSTGWAPQVNAGQFRLLVTWGARRTTSWPTIPTLQDMGINMVVNSPYGIAGPKGMEPTVVRAIHDAFKKGLDEPGFTATLGQLDQELIYMSSEDYHAFVMKQINEERLTKSLV